MITKELIDNKLYFHLGMWAIGKWWKENMPILEKMSRDDFNRTVWNKRPTT